MIKYLIAVRGVNEESPLGEETMFSVELISIEADVLEVRSRFSIVADGKEHKFKDPIDTIMMEDDDVWQGNEWS